MPSRQIAIEESGNGATLVRLSGELDKFAADDVRERLTAVAGSDPLLIDLGDVSFVDSAGLHCLFSVARTVAERHGRLACIVRLDNPIRRVLELVQLGSVAPLCETLREAEQAAREPNLAP